jgi:hypothetical protein
MSLKLTAFTGPMHAIDRAWPESLDPLDPYGGDEVLEALGSFDNYQEYSRGEKLEQAAWAEWDARFCTAMRSILRGIDAHQELALSARMLQIDHEPTHDKRPPRVAPMPISDSRLSDAVENWVPDIGVVAPDRVLGPWADEPIPRWLRSLCGKVLSFSPLLAPAVRPMGRECRSRPRPHLDQRRCMIAMLRAPTMLWWTDPLESALPISDRWAPSGEVSGLPSSPAFIGRIYRSVEGWHACCVMPLPLRPDPSPLEARLRLELMRLRRFERRMTWEDLLRDRGEVVYRSLCEQLWLHDETREALAACWSDYS